MSHEIMELDEIGLASVPAWHKLGTVVQGQMNPREAIARFLGWTTSLEPVYGKLPDGKYAEIPMYRVHSRMDVHDDRRFLAIVGDGYTPVAHTDMLDDIEAICGESGATVDTIGSLRNGRVVWVLCRLTEKSLIAGDSFDHYMLFANSHDGRRCYEILPTTIRVVCNNTWTASTGPGAKRLAFCHASKVRDRIAEARRVIGETRTSFARFADVAGGLVDQPVSESFTTFFVEKMFPTSRDDGKVATITQNNRDKLLGAIRTGGRGGLTRSTRRTAFGLYNAVTEYCEHLRRSWATRTASADESRLLSNWFGGAAELRGRALDFLTDREVSGLMEADSALDLVANADDGSILDGLTVAAAN